MFTEALQGLGLTVIQTTRFDPQRMKARFTVWLETVADEMAVQAREMIRGSGFKVDENPGGRASFRQQAINSIPFNAMVTKVQAVIANWSQEVSVPKMKKQSMAEMIGMLAISFITPWVGIGLMVGKMFGKKKKKMAIPWNTIYAQALTYAQEATVQEELQRIAEEVQQTKAVRQETMEKRSKEAALFKMPEGILSISKGGALVIAPVGPSVIRKK